MQYTQFDRDIQLVQNIRKNHEHQWIYNQPTTPVSLITEITDHLTVPFSAPVLVLFTVEWALCLRNRGFENISVAAYRNDAVEAFCKKFNFNFVDLTEKNNMKFDVIVGNPPYQGRGENSDSALWLTILNEVIHHLNDDGMIALVSPTSWIGRTTTTKKSNFDVFNTYQICALRIFSPEFKSRHFPGVGSTFCYYIIKKTAATTHTILILDQSTAHIDMTEPTPLPSIVSEAAISLHCKLATVAKFEVRSNYEMHSQRLKKINAISNTQDSEFRYKTFCSHSLIRYSNIKQSLFDSPKVLIPIVSTLKNAWADVDCNFGEDVKYIGLASIESCNNLVNLLNTKMYQYIGIAYRSGRNLGMALSMLPAIDTARTWSDDELYQHFNLTQDEIDLIESTVK